MESHHLLVAPPFTAVASPGTHVVLLALPRIRSPSLPRGITATRLAALKSPRGFGPPPPSKKKPRKRQDDEDEDDDDEEQSSEYEDVAIPQVVTDRMMRRVGLTVGVPLAGGLLFFPFFYYLKAVAKIDVPTWIPFIVSFAFFGTALLGISYGIVSTSWDPLREGSLLGWNEAQRNWPVFWESLRRGGGGGSGSSKR